MKYKVTYGNSVAVFPKSALEVISRAGADDLKVLLCLCASDGCADEKKLVKLTKSKPERVRDALSFWRGAGVIEAIDTDGEDEKTNESKESAQKKEKAEKKLQRSEELPNYTSDELSDILEKRGDTATLINECQSILGKVFSVHEINVLIGLVDYLSLDCEYVMILLTYCVSLGKKSLHYAEKLAFRFYDEGICTSEELVEELRKRELVSSTEGRIRGLFGLGDRAFTTKEKKLISSWVGEMGFSIDMIEKAYEVTADATGSASFPYANSVLERWYAAGIKTVEAVEEERSRKAEDKSFDAASFNTDDFFEAAIKRALGDN